MAVVGAGASGLAATRCLLDEGLEPVTFERSERIGGVWNYDESAEDGGGPAYRSLRTNTSRVVSGFSDCPLPGNLPDFPGQGDMLRYLHDYADYFTLRDLIRLNTRVESVRPLDDGRWSLRWSVGETSGIDTFDAVLVCIGLYHEPLRPALPGQERFAGRIRHSREYKEPSPFAGRRVVVVGAGSSGTEIAVELCQAAASVTLSTRGGVWFVPRYIGSQPYDYQLTRLGNQVPFALRMRVFHRLLSAEYHRLGLDSRTLDGLLPPPRAPFDTERSRFTPGAEVLLRAAEGRVTFKPGVERLTEQEVVFRDGSRLPVDDVILATGYRLDFPFLPESLAELTEGDTGLYRYVFPPEAPGLAFIGLCAVVGPYLPMVELQARWAARVLARRANLPPTDRMRREIVARGARHARRGIQPLRAQLVDYLDELAREIGVTPRPLKHPRLALPILLGPPNAALWRLDGPGSWPPAAQVLRAGFRLPFGARQAKDIAIAGQPDRPEQPARETR